jgi:hypothetical protein
MADEFQPQAQFALLLRAHDEIDRLLALPPERLAHVAPSVSLWSAEQHVAHLTLANELVVRNLKSLLKGAGPFVVETGELVPGALEILTSGQVPRGQAQSPRIVRPPEQVVREYLLDWIAGVRRDFTALQAQAEELAAARWMVPHQVLGPMTAAQWIRFALIHTQHHLAIAREALADVGAPSAN